MSTNLLLSVAAAGVYRSQGYRQEFNLWQGAAFVLGCAVVLWPLLTDWRGAASWEGVSVWSAGTPRTWLRYPARLLFLGLNPYLGLSTGGVFSMFSNLRTEGASSNHLLLGANPLKVWGYQEDTVEVVVIDPVLGQDRDQPFVDYLVPAAEFRKRLTEWAREGLRVPAVFLYEGRRYDLVDAVTEHPWRGERPADWYFDFRVIQKGHGPTDCRW